MFRTLESQDNFFRVTLSNQETIVLSPTFSDAASAGLAAIIKKFGGNTNLSTSLIVDRIKDLEFETEVFLTSRILEDIGYFKLAKDFDELSDFFLDKGKN